ncbi:cytochrome b-c1 complex subunit 9 [Lipomyces kononenkoae]
MAVSTLVYNTFIRRNSVFVSTILLGAFAFEIGFDSTIDKYWDRLNAGKQWKDIKHKYITAEE